MDQPGRGLQPSFSIVVETANLRTARHQRLIESLDSLANQVPSPAQAREVVVLDSGEAPPELIATLRSRYPWISICQLPPETDYGDQKSLAASVASGEVVVFVDSDCLYQPGHLASFLNGFASRPDVEVLAGETAVTITGPFSLAMALVFFFPRFSYATEVAPSRGFYGNNVAFRRDVLLRCPFPSGLPIYRGQNVVYSRHLHAAGIRIWRQPRARSDHSLPESMWIAIRRFFWTGQDTCRLARLRLASDSPAQASFIGDFEPYEREGGRVRKVLGRLRAIARQQPLMLLLLPVALPVALVCVASFFAGIAAESLRPAAFPQNHGYRPPRVEFTPADQKPVIRR
jgi:hypothetical protein